MFNKIQFLKFSIILVLIACLFSCKHENSEMNRSPVECITLLGDTLFTATTSNQKARESLEKAEENFKKNSNSIDASIWYGRRTAYTGHYQDAIQIYSKAISEHPEDARLYRHRGHRYISTRQFKKAIKDFSKATILIKGTKDKIEPDGLPNDRNIPLSTLHGNIWYHLGLAYYLQNDMSNALIAYSNRAVTEKYPDNLVSGGYWLYMIHRRLGNKEAADKAIIKITQDMDIIENMSYHKMCLFFKGLISEDEIANQTLGTSSSDVLGYGLGNWYLYEKKDTLKAKQVYERLLKKGNPYSFAYLSAEADYHRLFHKD